ncbi:MAG: TolC family protein [Sphingobacteriales bacterium]|nr:MAG: TolC family protein [Sphingobacteriales bacterium]
MYRNKLKIMKRVLALVVLLAAAEMAGAQQVLSLKQCIETAIQNNIDVLQMTNSADRSAVDKNQTKMNQLPDLNAAIAPGVSMGRSIDPFTNTYTDQKINSTSFGVNSGVVLFNGLSMRSSVKQTAAAFNAAKAGVQQQMDNIKIAVILAYLQALSFKEQITQASKQFDLSSEQVKRMQVLDNEGAVKPYELSDLKGQVANDQLSIISLKNNESISLVDLCRLMNVPYQPGLQVEPLNTDSLLVEYSVEKSGLYQTALQNLAQFKSLDYAEQAAGWAVKAQRGRLFPTLRFDANVNTYYSSAATSNVLTASGVNASNDYVIIGGQNVPVYKPFSNYTAKHIANFDQFKNNRYTSFNLTLAIPILNNFRVRNNIKLAKIDLKEAQQQTASAKTQLQLDIEQANQNLTTASDRYKTLLQQTKDYEQSFKAATVRFNEGVGNSIDYLTSKNNLDRANSNLIAARYDFVLRTKILDFYQAKPLW